MKQTWYRAIPIFYDTIAASASFPVAMMLHFGLARLYQDHEIFLFYMPLFGIISFLTFYHFKIYRRVWRHTSFVDVARISVAIVFSIAVFIPFLYYDNGEVLLDNSIMLIQPLWYNSVKIIVPQSLPFTQALCLIILVVGPRGLRRALYEGWYALLWGASTPQERVLFIGSGPNAALFIKGLSQCRAAPLQVVGIADSSLADVGRDVVGVPVLGTVDSLDKILDDLARKDMRPNKIVLDAEIHVKVLRRVRQATLPRDVPLVQLQHLMNFRDIDIDGIYLKPVVVDDLLSRAQMFPSMDSLGFAFEGRRILVTGAGGSIGSELCRQVAAQKPAHLMLLDFSEYNLYAIDMEIASKFPHVPRSAALVNVRDREKAMFIITDFRPAIVFHAAALKHVPLVELNPIEGIRTNVFGTSNVASAARDAGATAFVQVSTDKAVNPTNVMGATKRLAEFICHQLDVTACADGGCSTRFITVRFGNVLESSGSVVPLFRRQLCQGGPLTVTHPEVTRFFMTIPEAAGLVLRALTHALTTATEPGTIFVLDMGEPVRIADIARKMIRLAGLGCEDDVPIEFIGLRPGEKLHEELFDCHEERTVSGIDGILAARPVVPPHFNVVAALHSLAALCDRHDEEGAVHALARFVPGYSPCRGEHICDRDLIRKVYSKTGHGLRHERTGASSWSPIPDR